MSPQKPTTFEQIEKATCYVLSIDPMELGSERRHPRVVWARRFIIDLCRSLTVLSYIEIRKELGRPNHSTVITAHQTFRRIRATPIGDKCRLVPMPEDRWEDIDAVRNLILVRLNHPGAELPAAKEAA